VLIARHGKLAYEGYFEGDAATLRDTRSATKSITDVLIGISIDEHKLSGLDAKVLTAAGTRPQDSESRSAQVGDHDRGFFDHEFSAGVR